jgi:hypothetical protein
MGEAVSDVPDDVTHYEKDEKDQGDDAEKHGEPLVLLSNHRIISPRCS